MVDKGIVTADYGEDIFEPNKWFVFKKKKGGAGGTPHSMAGDTYQRESWGGKRRDRWRCATQNRESRKRYTYGVPRPRGVIQTPYSRADVEP